MKDNKNEIIKKVPLFLYLAFVILYIFETIKFSQDVLREYIIIAVISIVIYFISKEKGLKINSEKTSKYIKIICLILIIVGVGLRILLPVFKFNKPTGDELIFYDTAKSIAENGSFGPYRMYMSVFAYLIPYTLALSSAFKIFGTSYISVIILNVIIDILSAVLLFVIFKDKEHKLKSWIASALWIINPINIMWCGLCEPVIFINLFLILSIFIYRLFEKTTSDKKIVLGLLLGFALGFANLFRPIFVIFLIAVFINELYKFFIKDSDAKKFPAIGLIVMLLTYFMVGKAGMMIESQITEIKVSNSPGWSIFVGANLESDGKWSEDDSRKIRAKFNGQYSPDDIHKIFFNEAKNRYISNGATNNIKLFIRKYRVLTANTALYTSNTFITYQKNIRNDRVILLIKQITQIVFFILLILNFYYIIIKRKNGKNIFYVLLAMGLVVSHLFVEVKPRYTLLVLVPFTIIAATFLSDIIEKKKE